VATIGLIGGSGLDNWAQAGEAVAADTPYGQASAPVTAFTVAGHRLLFIPRHGGSHSLAPHRVNYRANIHLLAASQVDAVIAVNTVGAINPRCEPGSLAVPDQLIDYSWGREQSFDDPGMPGVQHVEFAAPFSEPWRVRLLAAVARAGLQALDGACVGVTQGPRLETAAEVRRLAADGCDLVGMTSMPEAALAREAGLGYACLALSANWAAGIDQAPINMTDIEATVAAAMGDIRRVVHTLLENLDD
jgi:purine nucleoside phosphorylase